MSKLRCDISMSLDGFVAGPNQSEESPLGENVGAAVMGRNMFGPIGGGAWGDEQWTGWWGDDPPYHYPVFILTHRPRDPVAMQGGTTFHVVPVLLGGGARLFDDLGDAQVRLEQVRAV